MHKMKQQLPVQEIFQLQEKRTELLGARGAKTGSA